MEACSKCGVVSTVKHGVCDDCIPRDNCAQCSEYLRLDELQSIHTSYMFETVELFCLRCKKMANMKCLSCGRPAKLRYEIISEVMLGGEYVGYTVYPCCSLSCKGKMKDPLKSPGIKEWGNPRAI